MKLVSLDDSVYMDERQSLFGTSQWSTLYSLNNHQKIGVLVDIFIRTSSRSVDEGKTSSHGLTYEYDP